MDRQTIQDDFNVQLKKWKQEISRLELNANELKGEVQANFEEQIAMMRRQWQQAQQSLREMEEAGSDTWKDVKKQYEQIMTNLESTYSHAAEVAGDSLGWPEGLAKERERNSEGWAEGLGEQPKNSEGWPEGVTDERAHNSRGWAEGTE